MEKDAIFRQRKELKKNGHAVVKSHYLVLIFLTLILVFYGTEYTYTTIGWGKIGNSAESSVPDENEPGNMFTTDDIYTSSEVWDAVVNGDVDQGLLLSEELMKKMQTAENQSKVLGRTNGVLAQMVNTVLSGRLFAKLGQTIRTITHSDNAVMVVFTLGSFLWYAMVFVFLKNVYSAVIRRIYLQARVYEKVSILDVTHFATVHKWIHVSFVMLVLYVRLILWIFTIVGVVIKYFAYWAVPYIVAENPAVPVKEAFRVSQKMMKGHKWELFKFEVTMFGWHLLSAVTLGISDMFYGTAYRLAALTEYYAKLREEYLRQNPDEKRILNDPYLFEKADRILLYETYFDVVDEITLQLENKQELTGVRKGIADSFGVWIGGIDQKKAYDDLEGRKFAVRRYKAEMLQESYPRRLDPLWRKDKPDRLGRFTFLRNYTIWTLVLLFAAFAFAGWSWEVALHFIQTGELVNRGTLYGPWLPIYGSGGVVVLLLCSRFRKNPVLEFFTSVALCGILEYTTGYLLETIYHQRWWSYDGYFLNLHGRICAEGLLVFGIGCCSIVYFVAPLFDTLLSRLKKQVLVLACVVFLALFGTDLLYSSRHPNMAEGAVEASREVMGEAEAG